jgi:hypothetical protein
VAVVAVAAGLIQAAAWLVSSEWSILSQSSGGRGALLTLALGSLLVIMAADRRPAASYGFFVGKAWWKLLLGGFALGASLYSAYCLAAWGLGAYRAHPDLVRPSRLVTTGLAALAAFAVALVQQIIFSGYLLSILRDRYGKALAVVVPALLFAVAYRMDEPAALLTLEGWPIVVGMFLVAALLGMMRLQSGNILLPSGFLAGAIYVRRLLRKTGLLAPIASSPLGPWLAPGGDPRQSPVLWGLVALGIVLCWLVIRRRGEGRIPDSQPAWDTDFKRVFPLSNGSMLAPLDVWLPRLVAARFRIGWKYWPRLVAILAFSGLSTVLTLPERLVLSLLLRRRKVADPVFILGVHRSGTTHLHNLLALDRQFCAPKAYHIMNPAGFNFSGWLITPLLGAFMPWKRPMDSVRFHVFAPQEEEFVLAGTSCLSPYWGMTFPRDGAAYDRYILPEGFSPPELARWKRVYLDFLRRLTIWTRRRPLLKNPYNTGRVAVLRAMFPAARFIHIYRHPYAVYRSNMHMAREGHIINQLQDPDPADSYQTRFLGNYRAMEDAFYRAAAELPAGQLSELRFEDLESDPIGQVRRIYRELGLEFTPQFEERLERYLDTIADYQKNRFKPLPDDQRRRIDQAMGEYMDRWGYAEDGGLREARPGKAA